MEYVFPLADPIKELEPYFTHILGKRYGAVALLQLDLLEYFTGRLMGRLGTVHNFSYKYSVNSCTSTFEAVKTLPQYFSLYMDFVIGSLL